MQAMPTVKDPPAEKPSNDADGVTEIAREATFTVARTFSSGQDDGEESGVIRIRRFETAPAEVYCEYGATINLGNYESAKVMVGVRMPCYAEEVEAAFQYAESFARDRVDAEATKIQKERGPF